ncbi:AcrB/AcrD/AcrF family protein [Salipiger thiooxidans]|uniref:AcrB/AcrD/AcrF family protein n=1 Tax=Salipiger thiooxidans TaxID=282683 RepID=A0A1G7JWQ5_9RHOB|nr:AcrB/AcrD/AcrF family protein [Salipiger thiooxidans]
MAWVLAIMTMLAGLVAFLSLPVAQYPDIAPTTVRVSAGYPGATAQAVENSVTRVIEDSMTGLDGMIYMTAQSSEGSGSVTLTFDDSVDPVDAQNEVQTKVAQVGSQLPSAVQTQVLLGTFAVLYATGYSINTFAMVLAIGLLVDDAIVVVENVERLMEDEGLSAPEATCKSMGQITAALLGINVVLAAVFLRMAFFGGSTGVIYVSSTGSSR